MGAGRREPRPAGGTSPARPDALVAAAHGLDASGMAHVAYSVLTLLHLALGRYPEAFDAAVALRAQGDGDDPFDEALPALVEAGVRGGRTAEATQALEEMGVRAAASPTPSARGVLARSTALVASDEDAEDHYRQAVALLAPESTGTGAREVVDHGRAYLLYGEWLRRRNRPTEARAALRSAHDLFASAGAAAFAERVRGELAATGELAGVAGELAAEVAGDARPPAVTIALTPQESKIARLAAGGATNQEIAGRLFISTNTVEYHLKKVFRKLGISSRRTLRHRLPVFPAPVRA